VLRTLADRAGVHANASLWYPPTGLTFALALVLRPREWPVLVAAVVLGTALGRDWRAFAAEPVAQAILVPLQALAHALPYLLAAVVLRRFTADRFVTEATPALTTLALWPVAAAGSAGLGAAIVGLHRDLPAGEIATLFVPWFTGDLVGVATTGSFFALALAPLLSRLLGPEAMVGESGPRWQLPRASALGLALVATLGLVTLARTPGLADVAGGVAVAGYGPTLALLLIARLAPPWQTHTLLAGLTLVIMTLTAMSGGAGHVDPQVLALALAAAAQLGVSMRGLAEASARDPLTGLTNRRAWLAGARRRLLVRRPWTVVLVDLDHFKSVNDRFGHAVGDEVLRAAAAQLCAGAGEDAWTGRIGGEEFAVLVPGHGGEAARRAERIRLALRAVPMPAAADGLVLRASFGIAPVVSPAQLPAALQAADTALYRAKGDGRDRVVHARSSATA
jgi:diguanylate cyclase (GGDEF)-like protein